MFKKDNVYDAVYDSVSMNLPKKESMTNSIVEGVRLGVKDFLDQEAARDAYVKGLEAVDKRFNPAPPPAPIPPAAIKAPLPPELSRPLFGGKPAKRVETLRVYRIYKTSIQGEMTDNEKLCLYFDHVGCIEDFMTGKRHCPESDKRDNPDTIVLKIKTKSVTMGDEWEEVLSTLMQKLCVPEITDTDDLLGCTLAFPPPYYARQQYTTLDGLNEMLKKMK